MAHYIALIHKDADSDYGVSFPDLPGVVTVGSDLDEARRMATEALAFHLEGLAEDGEAVGVSERPPNLSHLVVGHSRHTHQTRSNEIRTIEKA